MQIQNLIKGKKILNKKELMKAGEYYVRSAVMGGLICGSISPVVCVLRSVLIYISVHIVFSSALSSVDQHAMPRKWKAESG